MPETTDSPPSDRPRAGVPFSDRAHWSKFRRPANDEERDELAAELFRPAPSTEARLIVEAIAPELLKVPAASPDYRERRDAAIRTGTFTPDPRLEASVTAAVAELRALAPPALDNDARRERFARAFAAGQFGRLVDAWRSWAAARHAYNVARRTEHGLRAQLGLADPTRPPTAVSSPTFTAELDRAAQAVANAARAADDDERG